MRTALQARRAGFTLLETIIAIGVLAVLLTGFMIVFTPAAQGIRKSIDAQQADRLASTLEKELVTPRDNKHPTGFDKAFNWIKASNEAKSALLAYQYRGKTSLRPDDQTPEPLVAIDKNLPGDGYVVTPMLRQINDPKFLEDLPAVEGGVYLVKCTQLIFNNKGLASGTAGELADPGDPTKKIADPDLYPEAVIAFSADFHMLPSKAPGYFKSGSGPFATKFANTGSPVFTRNLAVRR